MPGEGRVNVGSQVLRKVLRRRVFSHVALGKNQPSLLKLVLP